MHRNLGGMGNGMVLYTVVKVVQLYAFVTLQNIERGGFTVCIVYLVNNHNNNSSGYRSIMNPEQETPPVAELIAFPPRVS